MSGKKNCRVTHESLLLCAMGGVVWNVENELILFDAIERYPPIAALLEFNLNNIRSFVNQRFVCRLSFDAFANDFIKQLWRRRATPQEFSLKDIYDKIVSLYNIHHEVSAISNLINALYCCPVTRFVRHLKIKKMYHFCRRTS